MQVPYSYALFDSLFELTKDKLYTFVLKHTRDKHQTEDILQYCYMKLWENIDKVDLGRIDNLMFTYAKNAVIDGVRRRQASILTFSNDYINNAAEAPAEHDIAYTELNARLNTVINKMPPKRKQVFILVREEGMSYDQVSAQLGISKLTIKKHMHEALRYIKQEVMHTHGENYVSLMVMTFVPIIFS